MLKFYCDGVSYNGITLRESYLLIERAEREGKPFLLSVDNRELINRL